MGTRLVDKISAVADRNIEHYVDKAEGKIESLGKKAEAKIAKWDKKKVDHMPGKKGSGVAGALGNRMRNAFSRGPVTHWTQAELQRWRNRKKPASGVFSQRFKRRSRAAAQAFRQAR